MKKLIIFVLTASMVLSLSLCAFAQTEDVKKDSAQIWKEYIEELKDILTESAKEKAKEDSDSEKLDELSKKYTDLLVKKVDFIKEIEKTSPKKAKTYNDEWKNAYKIYSDVYAYETAEWKDYLDEFRAAAEKYIEELEKDSEDSTDRKAAADAYYDFVMEREEAWDHVFKTDPRHAREFIDQWQDILVMVVVSRLN